MKKLLLVLAGTFSIMFLIFGFAGILQPETTVLKYINVPTYEAMKWFALSFVAALIPFAREISFFGFGLKLMEKLESTIKKIEDLERLIQSQKNKSREFLIKSFNEYLNMIPENVKNDKLFKLNRIYFKELGVSASEVKKSLNNWIEKKKPNNISKIGNLTEVVDAELIRTLKSFQEENQLKNQDGIFGYYTCEKLKDYID